ncbi:MAG: hypothetical protein IPQ25_03825 [Chitinophagaceae bacterium]|nr:hypothetical protein [Chitinophagaceae bacterium]
MQKLKSVFSIITIEKTLAYYFIIVSWYPVFTVPVAPGFSLNVLTVGLELITG